MCALWHDQPLPVFSPGDRFPAHMPVHRYGEFWCEFSAAPPEQRQPGPLPSLLARKSPRGPPARLMAAFRRFAMAGTISGDARLRFGGSGEHSYRIDSPILRPIASCSRQHLFSAEAAFSSMAVPGNHRQSRLGGPGASPIRQARNPPLRPPGPRCAPWEPVLGQAVPVLPVRVGHDCRYGSVSSGNEFRSLFTPFGRVLCGSPRRKRPSTQFPLPLPRYHLPERRTRGSWPSQWTNSFPLLLAISSKMGHDLSPFFKGPHDAHVNGVFTAKWIYARSQGGEPGRVTGHSRPGCSRPSSKSSSGAGEINPHAAALYLHGEYRHRTAIL